MIYTLKNGKSFLVDEEDIEKLSQYNWWFLKTGYIVGDKQVGGVRKRIYLHRFIMNAKDGWEIDHLNKDKSDNRKSNLRACTRSENGIGNVHENGSSQLIGVSKAPKNRWRARITTSKGHTQIGTYSTQNEAALAHDIVAIRNYGLYAKTNFLPPMPPSCKIEIKFKA